MPRLGPASLTNGRASYLSQIHAGGAKLVLCDYGDKTRRLRLVSSDLFMCLFPGLILFGVLALINHTCEDPSMLSPMAFSSK